MTFRDTLEKHLSAIQRRDLPALVKTLPDDRLVLIMSDGRLVQDVSEFIELHRGWFQQTSWTLQTEIANVIETPDLGVALIHLDYRDQQAGGQQIHETSYLTLIFARRGERWVMVQDQNTPIRAGG